MLGEIYVNVIEILIIIIHFMLILHWFANLRPGFETVTSGSCIGSDLTIRKSILERRLTYFGHIVRRNRRVEKQVIQGAAEARRGRGRPPISWTDDVKRATSHGMYGAIILASDRGRWHTLVKKTAAQLCAN